VLLKAILGNALTATSLRDGSDDFRGWSEIQLKKFLQDASRLLKCFFTLMHLTYGQPARAEELTELLLQNTSQEPMIGCALNGASLLISN
jgi:hypothetical protein